MHPPEFFRAQMSPLLDKMAPEDQVKARAALDRFEKAYLLLDTKYNRGIRERAAIHALLNKTSEDLLGRYRTIFEESGTAMIVIEQDGTISLANSKFEELTGYSRQEIEGKRHIAGFFEDEEQERVWRYHRARREGAPDIPSRYETTLRSRHKGLRNVAITTGLFAGTGQSIESLLDITEHKLIQLDIRRHRSQRDAVLSLYQLEDASISEIGNATVEMAVRMTGSRTGVLTLAAGRCDLNQVCWTSGIDHDSARSLAGGIVQRVMTGKIPLIDNQWQSPPGSETSGASLKRMLVVPVTEGDQVVAACCLFGSDSEYKESDCAQIAIILGTMWRLIVRQEQEAAIERANKKLNLLNSITRHDTLNAITGVLGCVDMARETESDAERDELLVEIKNLTRVIQGHIVFTKEYQDVGVNAPQWNNLRTLVDRAAGHFRNTHVAIINEIDNTIVFSDPMLERVLYNLIDNAIRYGEGITRIRFSKEISEDELVVTCEDDGIGVPEEMKEKIFDRGVGHNTGMGLFLSREIVSITGMTIRENGEPGKGARFEIRIPAGYFRSESDPASGQYPLLGNRPCS